MLKHTLFFSEEQPENQSIDGDRLLEQLLHKRRGDRC